MILRLKVKTGKKFQSIEKMQDGSFSLGVKSNPEKGKANDEVVKILSEHFSLPEKTVRIKSGNTSKFKIVEIN